MAFKGTLDTLSMIDVFQVIGMTRKAGCLVVKHPSGELKRLYFEAGDIVTATSNAAKDRLGAMLVKMALLSKEQVEASRKAEQITGVKQGQTLVDNGLVTEKQLHEALARQIAEIFYSVMTWHEGAFEFLEGDRPGPDVFRVRESVTNLIMQGTRQLDEWTVIEKVFPTLDMTISMSPPKDGGSDIHLQADEWQILTLIDGKRTIRQICGMSSFTNFEICKKLLNLHHAGLVAAGPSKAAGPRAPESAPSALVPAHFLPKVQAEFTRVVGPIAPIILDEIAEALGTPIDKLPMHRVSELTKLLCNEIDVPAKRDHFREVVTRAAQDFDL
jgi:hypothetical protein